MGRSLLSRLGFGRKASEDLVIVGRSTSEPMAQSWAAMLRNNNIPAMVKSGGPGFSFGGPPPFGASTFILVPRPNQEAAVNLLEPFGDSGDLEIITK